MKKKMKNIPAMEILGVIGGAIGAQLANKALEKMMPNSSPILRAFIPLGAGVFLAMQKNAIVKGAGYGMIGKGGSNLVDAFLPAGVNGIEDYFMNEPAGQSVLSEPAGQNILSAAYDEEGNVIGYTNSAGDFIEAPEEQEIMYVNAPEGADADQDRN